MFRGVAARDWPPTGLTTARWMAEVPAMVVTIANLWATQEHLHTHALTPHHQPYGIDPLPHVIRWRGHDYVEDGHHRITRAAMTGKTHTIARVLVVT